MWYNRQQACPFPAGVVSLVFGEVKHIVHPIRWNLKAVYAFYGWPEHGPGLAQRTISRFRNWILLVKTSTSVSFLSPFEQCTRGQLLRRHGLLRRSLHLLLRRGHNQRRVHIYLDILRHCILHGLRPLRSCRLPQPHHLCHSHHWPQLLMRYHLPTSCLQWPHPWFLKPPWCTPLHRLSLLPRHPPLQLHGILLPLHRLHRLLHRHHCRALRTHLAPFTLHHWLKHLRFLLMDLNNLQSRPPQSFALTRNLTNHAVQLQKPHFLLHHRHQRQHRLRPSRQNLQRCVPLHNNLLNRFV